MTPTFLLDRGLPAYPLPPQIDPSFANNTNVDYWNGREALLPATYDGWTVSVQRELRRGMTLEVDYNGSKGTNLQGNLLNLNQVPLSVVNDLIARFGAAGAVALLNSQITSATAVAAGITPPYPNFTNPAVQTHPQRCAGAAAVSAVRDRQHHRQRRRQDRTIDVPRRRPEADAAVDRRLRVPGQLHLLEADDRRRHLQRQLRLDGYRAARPRVLDRTVRSAAQHQAGHGVRVAVRAGTPLAARRGR